MDIKVKGYFLGKGDIPKEIRSFMLEHDIATNYEYLLSRVSGAFSILKGMEFAMFYKDKDGDLIHFCTSEELTMGYRAMRDPTFRLYIKEVRHYIKYLKQIKWAPLDIDLEDDLVISDWVIEA